MPAWHWPTTCSTNALVTRRPSRPRCSWLLLRSPPAGLAADCRARTVNTIVGEVGRIHDLEVDGAERKLGTLRPHDARHTFAYRL